MKTPLEKQLDERLLEIGFPNPDDLTIPAAMRLELAKMVGQFYNGEMLVVDRAKPGHLRIYTRPPLDIS